MNRKGFTLVELLATLVILGLIVSIGSVAITKTIKNSREKNYNILIENIKSAVSVYYQECEFAPSDNIDCTNPVKISTLIDGGFISPNYDNGSYKYVIDPRDDGKNETEISRLCNVRYYYDESLYNLVINDSDFGWSTLSDIDC